MVAPGLSAKVLVVRDEQGVPTIEASTLEDLFFAQGYVTAQDRLWQMDIMRRAAAGELSEIIGEDTLKMDREQRILGLRVVAEAAQKSISARDRAYFDAYTRGVNAFIESHRDHLPLEFWLLKYQPRPWTVTDSLLVGARMVEDLNHYSYARALTREKVLAKIGPELTADLYVNSSWHDRPPTEVRHGIDQEPAVMETTTTRTRRNGPARGDDQDHVDGFAPTRFRARGRYLPPGLEQLGRFWPAHDHGEAAVVERHASRPPDAELVVCRASQGKPATSTWRE